MNKRRKTRSKVRAAPAAPAAPTIHPLIAQANITAEQSGRYHHVVAEVANPYGEVVQRGEFRRHKAVKRLPHFEALFRAKVFDRTVFTALEWYDEQQGAAAAGMFKCGLAGGGGGGSSSSHIPTSEMAMQARSNVEWALDFIPPALRPVFVAVMHDDETFEEAGRRLFANLSTDRARRRVSTEFKLAANHLLLGIGGPLRLMPKGSEDRT